MTCKGNKKPADNYKNKLNNVRDKNSDDLTGEDIGNPNYFEGKDIKDTNIFHHVCICPDPSMKKKRVKKIVFVIIAQTI